MPAAEGEEARLLFLEAQTKDYIVDCNTTSPVYTKIDEGDTISKRGKCNGRDNT